MTDTEMYKTICSKRFDELREDVQGTTKEVNMLNAIVTNGLSHRVRRIERLLWGMIATAGGWLIKEVLVHIFGS